MDDKLRAKTRLEVIVEDAENKLNATEDTMVKVLIDKADVKALKVAIEVLND